MTGENFAYWLQGFFEISQSDSVTKEQVEEIKNHLKLVFNKITPTIYTIDYYRDGIHPNFPMCLPHASC